MHVSKKPGETDKVLEVELSAKAEEGDVYEMWIEACEDVASGAKHRRPGETVPRFDLDVYFTS